MQLTKTQSEFIHAQRRARQRYGILYTRDMLKQIRQQIQSGRARKLFDTSNTRDVYEVQAANQAVIVSYSHKTNNVVTFLPRNYHAPKCLNDSSVRMRDGMPIFRESMDWGK